MAAKTVPFSHANIIPAMLACAVILFCVFGTKSAAAEKVTLQLAWKHQFQFAGYYTALHRGYYKEEGLDVTIAEGGEDRFAREQVLNGNAQYGVAGAELILHRADGEPFVVLAPIFQHSPSSLLLRKDSGINTLQGLIGKKVMLLPGKKDADILAAFVNEGIPLDTIKRVDQSYNLNDLIQGRTAAVSAYSTNEPWILKKRGVQPKIISPRTYGVDFYADCLFSTEKEIAEHPERVKKFLKASIRGWEYAMSHIDESIELILREYNPNKSLAHLKFEAEATKKLMLPDLIQIGHMNAGRWRHIVRTYSKLGMLEADFSLDGFLYEPDPHYDYTVLMWTIALALLITAVAVMIASVLYSMNKKLSREIQIRERAEKKHKESEERLRTLINATPDIICFKDGKGRWLEANQADLRLFGLSEVDYKYKTDSELAEYTLPLYKEAFLTCEKSDENTWQAGKTHRGEEIVPTPNGEHKVFDVIKIPLFKPDGTRRALVVLGRDITDFKNSEKEKMKMRDQILQTQKMESIGRLAGGVAHDLNNMLSAILGYGEILISDPQIAEKHREKIELMHRAGVHSRDLVRQLLAFSRKQTLYMQTLDLNSVLNDFEKFLGKTIREDIDIRVNLDREPPIIEADRTQLEQTVLNLTLNAQDAMPEGGVLQIETGTKFLSEDELRHYPDCNPGRYALLRVSDTGSGMTPETRENIFEPFFTTKESGAGSGLGLATVYGIIKQHRGIIQVYSEKGQGSTFKIYFPLAEHAREDIPASKPEKETGTNYGRETIMLVEDDEMVRELTEAILEEQGYNVLVAADGKTCLETVKKYPEKIHLLLTDVIMPGLNGKQLRDKVIAILPEIKVIYVSGYAENIVDSYGIAEDNALFIQKPYSVELLRTKVREVLDAQAG
ncbi:MAG: ABC transporter substrate-binding protein [Desulfovibrionales bacterium]